MVVHTKVDDQRARLITGAILVVMTLAMATPFGFQAAGYRITLVEDLGFAPGDLASPPAWISALALACAYIAWTFRAAPFVRSHWREISWLKVVGIAAAFASGIMEEVVFRRYLMDLMLDNGLNDVAQVAGSAIVFGLAHLIWRGFGGGWRTAAYAAGSTTVAGLALGALYLLSDRSLGPCILAHTLINLVIEPWLLLSVVRDRADPGDRS